MLLMFFLVSCQKETTEVSNLKVETPTIQVPGETPTIQVPATQAMSAVTTEHYIFKTSEPNMVTLHGVLLVIDPFAMLPDPKDAIFLVPLALEGTGAGTIPPFTIGEVPQADVDEITGEFVFTNLQPGQYAVVVLVQGGSQVPVHNYQSNNLAILRIENKDKGSTIDLGYLSLP